MCQEIPLTDIRSALLDCFDDTKDENAPIADLLAHLDAPYEESMLHAFEHARRAERLVATGDKHAASIHEALLANMARAAD